MDILFYIYAASCLIILGLMAWDFIIEDGVEYFSRLSPREKTLISVVPFVPLANTGFLLWGVWCILFRRGNGKGPGN